MKFAIVSHVSHLKEGDEYLAYAPYVREMNIWLRYVDEVIIVAPLGHEKKTAIDLAYAHPNVVLHPVPKFDFLNLKSIFWALITMPGTFWQIYKVMRQADHIHLRCPGNMGLLGCLVQILFPRKPKTAKYAGNWDLQAKQPLSYRIQKWVVRNTFLTKNIQVLVYGDWPNSTKNIKPFFTASYFETDKIALMPKGLAATVSFIFVGTLANGKHPLYAIQLVERLHQNGYNVNLKLYGEGAERSTLENYIAANNLESVVFIKGNQDPQTIKEAYIENHFVVLPSESEGWPKAVAEGMFFGCLPIATSVSCVPTMLDYGKRGVLLKMNLQADVAQIVQLLNDSALYEQKVESAMNWSRMYTLDVFESEIKSLLQ